MPWRSAAPEVLTVIPAPARALSTVGPDHPGDGCAATAAVGVFASAERAEAGYARYYFSVSPAQTLASGLVNVTDIAGLARFATSSPKKGAALGAELDRLGVTGAIRTKVLAPFLPGVVADDPDAVDAGIGQFLLTTFALGGPTAGWAAAACAGSASIAPEATRAL